MNILLVVPWDQEFGGVTSVVKNLASYLSNQKHNIIFLHPSGSHKIKGSKTKLGFSGYKLSQPSPFRKNRPIISVLAFFAYLPITVFQILYILIRHRIQIVNVHYPLDNSIYLAMLCCMLPIKLVISIHGADFFPSGEPRKEYSVSIRLLLLSSDLIIAPSKAFLDQFLKEFPKLKSKATFVHNCVDLSELKYPITKQNNSSEVKYILCIAAHNEKKGLDVLLHAYSLLKDTNPLLNLVFVGDGPLRDQLEKLAAVLKVHERTKFLGQKGRDGVVRLLHDCEIFVLPSKSEPFGIVVIEALACKKPVVASAVGGIPEIIENGKNGLLVSPGDPIALANAIKTVIEDHRLSSELAAKGRITVLERFVCEKNGSSYEKLFYSLNSKKN